MTRSVEDIGLLMSVLPADAVVILNGGRVVFDGDPAAIRDDEQFLDLHLGVTDSTRICQI